MHHQGSRLATLRRVVLASVAVLALGGALGACGSSDEDDVKDQVNSFRDAAKDKDAGKLCDTLSNQFIKDQAGGSKETCEKALNASMDQLSKNAEKKFEITSVKVDGDKATVKTKTGDEGESTSQWVKEDGKWKLTAPSE